MKILIFFLIFIIGLGIGGLILFLFFRSKLKNHIQRNNEIAQENEEIIKKNNELKNVFNNLTSENVNLLQQIKETQSEYNIIYARKEELKNNINDLENQSKQAAEQIYKATLQVAQASFDKEIENISVALEKNREEAKKTYFKTIQECVLDFQKEIDIKSQELLKIQKALEQEQKNIDIAIMTAKRKEEIENKKDFYRLVLIDEDILEIKRLREVLPYLRDKTSLNKVIYKVYYEKPLTDMIGRVVGSGIHTGIYKITNLSNKKCYVGQSVNIADRWRQHVKRGVGAEDWTRNKLYPAMYSLGVENFSFEIIEECDRSKLNEREDYWQEFFHAKDFGYSIK